MRIRTAALTSLVLLALLSRPVAARPFGSRPVGGAGSLLSSGITRTYWLHLPPKEKRPAKMPLVLVLHGGGGTGRGNVRLSGGTFDKLGDRDGFAVVYPDGIEKGWNDGRKDLNQAATLRNLDDVRFLCDLVDKLAAESGVDPANVFSCGISNGGFMSFRLAHDVPQRVRAIAPVAACLGLELSKLPPPAAPVPLLVILGTEDPLVPYGGGRVGFVRKNRGTCLSAAETVKYWTQVNGCSGKPARDFLPDRDPQDGTKAVRAVYGGCKAGTEVVLVSVQGGGHTWPGGWQYLPERMIGKTCRDFDAAVVIWDFFKRHLSSASGSR
ncbi:MAG: alpha/beta fold hydrolase [Candidatus Wallbacteria bacterium]|nr:alpha/beta fold hydrolase [Candidatus Wallbacteria bacterium]